MMGVIKRTTLCFAVILLLVSPVFGQYLVANSKDWRDVYLSSIYASYKDSDVVFFKDLVDSKYKTQEIPKGARIIVHESSSQPVVKNYKSYLRVNGYSDYDVMSYNGYSDLQKKLWEDADVNGFFLLDPTFGVEAMAVSSIALKRGYATCFLNESNKESVKDLVGDSDALLVGHFPIRVMEGFDGPMYTSWFDENTAAVMSDQNYVSEWGILTSPNRVLPSTLIQGNPVFVYYGDLGETSAMIRNSGIDKYEIIGGHMANTAKDIERYTGQDLKLLLRYGKTMTNVRQFRGRVMDIDTIEFEYPKPSLSIVGVDYYPELQTTAVRFRNNGNIRLMFYTNIEIGDSPVSDENSHSVGPGESVTIPYPDTSSEGEATVTTQYGYKMPFEQSIKSESGDPFVVMDAEEKNLEDDSEIMLLRQEYDNGNGRIVLTVKNPNKHDIVAFGEFILGDDVLSSTTYTIQRGDEGIIGIETPYHTWEDIEGKNHTLNLYFGKEDTIKHQKHDVLLKEFQPNLISGRLVEFGAASGIILLVIIAVIIFFVWKRKNKKIY